jgi:oligoribonuclease
MAMTESKGFQNRPKLTDRLLWTDLETTGSNVDKDCIIEIGCILTTHDLIPLGEFTAIVKPDPCGLGRLLQNSVVRAMHEKNGLLADILESTDDDRQHHVTARMISWLTDLGTEKGGIALAGSGVGHFDSQFVRRYMPQLAEHLRYWVIDIGTIRRAHDMWVGTTVSTANDRKTHRALDDIRCHLEEAQAFRDMWRGVDHD